MMFRKSRAVSLKFLLSLAVLIIGSTIASAAVPAMGVDVDPRAKIALTPAQLDKLVGYYELEKSTLFVIQRRGNFLYAQLNFQPAELLPQDDLTFMARRPLSYYCPDLGLIEGRLPKFPWFCQPGRAVRIRFDVGSDGNARELVLDQDGVLRRARRLEYSAVRDAALAMSRHALSNRASPDAGAALRKLLDSMQSGAPDYTLVTPEMAAVLKGQYPAAQAKMRSWGAVKNLWFQFVDSAGADYYQVEFERAHVVCAVMPLADGGKISDESCRYGPDEFKQRDHVDIWSIALDGHSLRRSRGNLSSTWSRLRYAGGGPGCLWPTNVCD